MRYPHLKLTDWPFQTVPDPRFYAFMADRSQVQSDIQNLLRNMQRREQSSIHLVWAWYGSGKTHTMRHFCHLCHQSVGASLTSYSEFPKSATCFLDLYKGFAEGLDTENLKESLVDLYTTPGIETVVYRVRTSFPDFEKAIHSIVLGNDAQQLLGLRWLKADKIPLRDLHAIGIGQRLETGEGAIKVISLLAELISCLGRGKNSVGRLVWVVDEFQLVGDCRQATIHEITGSLHSVFNRTPNNLTLFISFSGKPEKKFPAWVSRELADRIGIEKVILLPPLTTNEAVDFMHGLFSHFRAPEGKVPQSFPFEEEAVHEILRLIQKSKCELKPRTLMQAFGTVLEEADPLIERGALRSISPVFAQKVLEDRLFPDNRP